MTNDEYVDYYAVFKVCPSAPLREHLMGPNTHLLGVYGLVEPLRSLPELGP